MQSDCSFNMLLWQLPRFKKYIVDCFCCCGYQSGVSSLLKFWQFCMHDFERNINDKNQKQLSVDYAIECLLKKFDSNVAIAPLKSKIIFQSVESVHLKL